MRKYVDKKEEFYDIGAMLKRKSVNYLQLAAKYNMTYDIEKLAIKEAKIFRDYFCLGSWAVPKEYFSKCKFSATDPNNYAFEDRVGLVICLKEHYFKPVKYISDYDFMDNHFNHQTLSIKVVNHISTYHNEISQAKALATTIDSLELAELLEKIELNLLERMGETLYINPEALRISEFPIKQWSSTKRCSFVLMGYVKYLAMSSTWL